MDKNLTFILPLFLILLTKFEKSKNSIMKTSCFTLLLSVLSFNTTFAQSNPNFTQPAERYVESYGAGQNLGAIDTATEVGFGSKIMVEKVRAIGSPYIHDDYQPVRITNYENHIYYCRYNAHSGEMEVKLAQDNIIALNNNMLFEIEFTRTGKTYKTYSYTDENDLGQRGFLAVAHEDENFSLLKKEEIQYHNASESYSSYNSNKPAKYRRKADVYYLLIGEKITIIPNSERKILNTFESHKKKIKSFIKTNKLNPKKEPDLIKIAEYIATINFK